MTNMVIFLPPAKEVCEGYVFTGVCLSGGHAWQEGGMCGWRGACMAGRGGVHGRGACMACACAWQGACMTGVVAHTSPQQILRETVNERAERILLECILVGSVHQR